MKRSYISIPLIEPYIYKTIPDRLKELAGDDPGREAFVFYDLEMKRVPVTRKQLYDTSVQLGKTFVNMGLQKGDKVAFCMNNSIEMLFANMAVITAGGIPFYLSTNMRDGSDIIKAMNLMECKMLIIDTTMGGDNLKILDNIWPTTDKEPKQVPSLWYIICNAPDVKESGNSRMSLANLITKKSGDDVKLPSLDPEDILAYLVTSGSTGESKNVAYTHFSLLNWSRKSEIALGIKDTSRLFNDRQFSWAVGYPRAYPATGSTRIFIDTRMSLSGLHIDRLADIVEREQCDIMYVPGYIAKDLLENPQLNEKFKSVGTVFLAGERVPKANAALKGEFFKNVFTHFGTSESGGAAVFTSDNIDDYEDGIIGKPLEGVEMKIVNENGTTVPFGDQGELCVRTPYRFVQYKGMDELFHEVVDKKSWFHTGDVAHFREDGNIVVDGRQKEYVAIQTVKYFPWEVETALHDLPGAKFVIAVGVPDEKLSNVFCACVVPKPDMTPTVDDVKGYCDEVFLEEGTVGGTTIRPRYCLIFDKLLLTSSGKLNRRAMAKAAKERLGL